MGTLETFFFLFRLHGRNDHPRSSVERIRAAKSDGGKLGALVENMGGDGVGYRWGIGRRKEVLPSTVLYRTGRACL